jgi:hypothetical protein
LLALLDDIASVLDDVAVLTKIAAKKTSGVLGDDLALNAEQVSGVRADRELPVVWAVAKGSARNKTILVPAALLISWAAPWLVAPLLMAGGSFLCFEGAEKIAHKLAHRGESEEAQAKRIQDLMDGSTDVFALEKGKIRGAIRTDFVLSAEIIVITLGTVAEAAIVTRIAVLTGVAILMTVGVYGLVAAIVKLDDGGLYLSQRTGEGAWARVLRGTGWGILKFAPYLMKGLSVVGTAAMFLVGGGILAHGIHLMHALVQSAEHSAALVPGVGSALAWLVGPLLNGLVGVLAGAVVLALVTGGKRILALRKRTA